MDSRPPSPPHRFAGEPITPVDGSFDTGRMAMGEPGLPRRFRCRGEEHEVARVIDTWKETGACRHGSGERYVRKHWFLVETVAGAEMRIYFDRQGRPGARRRRWWLASVAASPPSSPGACP